MNQWREDVTAGWGDDRVRFAFIVAPLASPAIMFFDSDAITRPGHGSTF
jgi:hypothetical protein